MTWHWAVYVLCNFDNYIIFCYTDGPECNMFLICNTHILHVLVIQLLRFQGLILGVKKFSSIIVNTILIGGGDLYNKLTSGWSLKPLTFEAGIGVESMPVLFALWSEVSDCNHSATPPLLCNNRQGWNTYKPSHY